jgi:hypothetical protein
VIGVCVYCGAEGKVEVEHVEPLCRGGTDTPDNMVPACFKCNRSKGSRFILEWVWGIKKPKRPDGWATTEAERIVAQNPDITPRELGRLLGMHENAARTKLYSVSGGIYVWRKKRGKV